MKKVGVTLCGKRYEMNLDEAFAAFVETHLQEAGIDFAIDNRPEALLKAYLRLAKQIKEQDARIQTLLSSLDEIV